MNEKIAVIGLGYVGLPLAVEFSKKYLTIGYDINISRVSEINNSIDSTMEVSKKQLKDVLDLSSEKNSKIGFIATNDKDDIKNCNIYIITVPTPITKTNEPDFKPLISATKTISEFIKKDDLIIYESTVYPGATEEICIPIIENISALKLNFDFHVGYSPERINPGDKKHTVTKILKVTSGSNKEAAIKVDKLYASIIEAGTFMATSIKVAEAAKVIENSQRDINIAFINELSKIFNLIDIDTNEVLEAASTKWNFLNFKPGLVGGHCIGVDPYYLSHKAQELGYYPEIILAGRKMNDSMGSYVARETVKIMTTKEINILNSDVLIMGFTFKENCPDIRNTRVIEIVNSMKEYGANVKIFDPLANPDEIINNYNLPSLKDFPDEKFDAIIIAVSHEKFFQYDIQKLKKNKSVVFDVKGNFKNISDATL